MKDKKYEISEAQQRNTLPDISLMLRPHNGKDVRISTFGGNYYFAIKEMEEHYWHSRSFPDITFAPVTSAEAISYAAFDLEFTKREIFEPSNLNAGLFVRTKEGVYVNPGEALIRIPAKELFHGWEFGLDERTLRRLKNNAVEVNGIYLGEKDYAFAPWESFKTDEEQTVREFVEGGLARALEHTSEKVAPNLHKIASSYLWNTITFKWFDPVEKPTVGELNLRSRHGVNYDFEVHGNSYYDNTNIRDKPNSPVYCTIDRGGTAFGKLLTNRDRLVK